MNFLSNISVTELGPLLSLVHESTTIKRHFELFAWLQNQVQRFLPHDILIAAWGDFSRGQICHDIVSPMAGMRTDAFGEGTLQPFLGTLFKRWHEGRHLPYLVRTEGGFYHEQLSSPVLARALASMRCGLVHGIKDQRGHHDCLYVFLGHDKLGDTGSRDALRFLLPHIDMSFRQIGLLPGQHFHTVQAETRIDTAVLEELEEEYDNGLSNRETEIMHWVGLGKTNQEIGLILSISAFTVKNHLQRIFRKLNVSNRAQALAQSLSRH
ncbi:MAG TPA: XrtB/PEP-CTERM-associated transcriptional regulator EpsA [Rhodocyclaceae bacterium]|nr:XrtB/PEP-CTERM-associated transcriptional regulator EpsA [Rhodocyclaceae bacterium]